jgi:hypothetical protein
MLLVFEAIFFGDITDLSPQTARPDIDVPEVKHKLTRFIGCQWVI